MSCLYPLIRIDAEDNKYRALRLFGQQFILDKCRKPHNGAYFVSEKVFLEYFPDYLKNEELALSVQRVGCGQCIECRLAKSREWALRVMLEASFYKHNYFVTLTYNDDCIPLIDKFIPSTGEFVPDVPTLDKSHMPMFMKRLRSQLLDHCNHQGVRFFGCGEYGELYGRPHMHLCLMNMPDLTDNLSFLKREDGINLYTSSFLESSWLDKVYHLPLGFVSVGELTWESAAYTARYIMKKQLGQTSNASIIERENNLGFEGLTSLPEQEFVLMSRRPGIARSYYDAHADEIFNHDTIVAKFGDRVYQVKPCTYFDRLYDNVYSSLDHARQMSQIRLDRSKAGLLSSQLELSSTSMSRSDLLESKVGKVMRRERRSRKRRDIE